jgi:hypothetical protein
VDNLPGGRPLRGSGRRWEDNINRDVRELAVEWKGLSVVSSGCIARISAVFKFRSVLTRCSPVSGMMTLPALLGALMLLAAVKAGKCSASPYNDCQTNFA